MNCDIIGDVHGQHDKLAALLQTLGYRETMHAWRHPERTAIFVGDLIDHGPRQVDTLKLVRGMVDAGAAMAILGDHEFDAIAWATPDPERPHKRLRRHDQAGSRERHRAFLDEVAGKPLHREIVAWFKTLPLWLDLCGIRVVHARWCDDHMTALRPLLGKDGAITDELLVHANRNDNPAHAAIEALCRGREVDSPDAAPRRWWEEAEANADSGLPVFFGHYRLAARPAPMAAKLACVDYGAADGGPLVAYRWEGEPELRDTHFIWT